MYVSKICKTILGTGKEFKKSIDRVKIKMGKLLNWKYVIVKIEN